MNKYNKLYLAMTDFFAGDVKRIQHFVKVHSFAKIIGEEEGLDGKTQGILEAAALVHDIGIKPAEEKYGRSEGKLQEQEGPVIAEKMLHELEFAEDVIKRVAWLVAHHHTYSHIEAPDHQILVEADFLVNFYEGDMNEEPCGGYVFSQACKIIRHMGRGGVAGSGGFHRRTGGLYPAVTG